MQPHQDFISAYWGKARKQEFGPDWHPLVYHSLDVAAAMKALLEQDPLRWRPLIKFGSTESVQSGLILAAALHDLGKFTPAFQRKVDVLPTLKKTMNDDPGHDHTGGAVFTQNATKWRWNDYDGFQRLKRWCLAACCHHGRPRPSDKSMRAMSLDLPAITQNHLSQFAIELLQLPEFQSWTELFSMYDTPDWDDQEDSVRVAGLVTIADWIGSNTEFFPYKSPDMPFHDYWVHAKQTANQALKDIGLTAPLKNLNSISLGNILQLPEDKVTPTPLQKWASECTLPAGPAFAILEDLTGAGKTEAAAILAGRLLNSDQASGVYWAMPTMATANAMFGRMAPLADTFFGDAALSTLMGGKRMMNKEFRNAVSGNNTVSAEITCSSWVAKDARLGFLAPMGAGTIDQALLGILPSRHFPVRYAGLAGRILIIDEAHAYDAYTGSLMGSLIEQHARHGGSIIVLSATLTSSLHSQLLEAWHKGRASGTEHTPPKPLPCATLATDKTATCVSFDETHRRGTLRDTPVKWCRTQDEAVKILTQAHEDHASALWIRNTVDDALEAAVLLEQENIPHTIFHARFVACDRAKIERKVLNKFGKDRPRNGGILISTQVVEQSLDLDFDIMISDLAPFDSLVQRAGRLHRHKNIRPQGYEKPILYIYGPEAVSDATDNWYKAFFPRGAYVYRAHGRLWRTAKRLELDGGLLLKSESPRELLDWVYDHDTDMPDTLLKIDEEIKCGEDNSKRGAAKRQIVQFRDGYQHGMISIFDEEVAVTRLGAETQSVMLARICDGKIIPWIHDEPDWWRAWNLSEVSVRRDKVGTPGIPTEYAKQYADLEQKFPWSRIVVLNQDGEGQMRMEDIATEVVYSSTRGLRLI